MNKIAVITPVYKKESLFLKHLAANYPYFASCSVCVVNDDPKSILDTRLAREYPDICMLHNARQMGFAASVNRGIRHTKSTYILLLNSDVLLHGAHFQKAAEFLDAHKDYFAVSFKQYDKGKTVGKNQLYFSKGFVHHRGIQSDTSGVTGWAEGGSALFRRSYFEQLYLDELYSPVYWEDVDVSYRACKRGWRVYFDADCEVTHHHQSTTATYFTRSFIQKIAYRNQFIFIWKNITDHEYIKEHVKQLPLWLLSRLVKKDSAALSGFVLACWYLPKILQKRNSEKLASVKRDKEVLNTLI